MKKRDPLNTVDSSMESEGQESLKQPEAAKRKRKRFIEPSISEPLDVLKTTAFFFQDAPGDSGCFGENCP